MDKVKDIMTKGAISVFETDTIAEAAKVFARHNISCVIVVNKENRPVGIITERDMVKKVIAGRIDLDRTTAKQVMSSPVLSVEPEQSFLDAGRFIQAKGIRKCAVVKDGELVGLITQTDIVRGSLALIKHLNWKLIKGSISLNEYANILKEFYLAEKAPPKKKK